MASISNLSVIISGQTDPLAKALKKAEKDVASFKQSSTFKEGLSSNIMKGVGFGMGMFGLDSLGRSIKKAAKDVPELHGALERLEGFAGRMILNAGLDKLILDADKFDQRMQQGFVGQELKEEAMYWAKGGIFNHEEAKKTADWARQVFVQTKLAEQAEIRRKDAIYQRNIEESRRLREQIGGTELQDKIYERMMQKRNSLNPNYEKEQYDLALKEAPDSVKAMLMKDAQKDIEQYEKHNKLMDEEKQKRSEIESLMQSATDQLYQQQYGEIELQMRKLGLLGASVDEMKKYRDLVEETNYLKMEEEFWKVADEEALKDYEEKLDKATKRNEDMKFAGAASAGSQEAYSAIVNGASAADIKQPIVEQVTVSKEQLAINKKILEKQGDPQKILAELKKIGQPTVITFGGG